ncbi:immunoglobulin-like domain-containing protein, partial [Pseudomonas sp. NPDC008258]|uniref:immunoglobulin-like domain-containing protein n=1 Tax=Pseudomonas sp. NPDC008258 TaxID=3364418 RepID=UPI0036EB6103
DTPTEVVAKLTASAEATEGGTITYTVTLTGPNGLPINNHGALTFTLADKTVINVAANATTGSVTVAAPDNPYIGQTTITNTLDSVGGAGASRFEQLTLDKTSVNTIVKDEAGVGTSGPGNLGDVTTVGITGTTSLTEGETGRYTLTLSNPSKAEVTITLSYSGTARNGEDFNGVTTVKIPANSSGTTFDIATIDDKLVEGTENFVVKIETATGGNFENLQVDSSKSSVTTAILDNDHLPVSTGGAVTGVEDTDYIFNWSDFNVTDADGNTGLFVTITSIPADGALKYYNSSTGTWQNVTVGQVVSQADIIAKNLKFVPALNQSGVDGYGGTGIGNKQADYAQFKYKANDGTNLGSEVTMKVDISPVADQPTLIIGSTDVVSKGLTKEVWTTLKNLGTGGNGITGEELKTVFANSGNASSSGTVTNVQSDGSVNAGSGSKTSGLIYLEAGKTYTFSGIADDSLVVTVGGNNVASATWGAGGQISGTFTPKASGYYPIEVYHANQSGPGSYDLNIQAGSGAAVTDLSSGNIPLYQSVAEMVKAGLSVSDLHTVNGQSYYDGYKLNEGPENGTVKLVGISTNLTDTDGSENLVVKLSGIPAGSVLSDGAGHTVTVGATAVDVTGWNLGGLSIKPPAYYHDEFVVKVTSTSTESVGGSKAVNEDSFKVTVHPDIYNPGNLTSDNDTYTGTINSDIIVADVTGLHVTPGQDYNLAFIVDTSGSMETSGVNAARNSLKSVFETLANSVKGAQSGTVNILLVDFSTQVNSTLSIRLGDSGALDALYKALNAMYAGGSTNYEDAFKTTANWFQQLVNSGNTGTRQTFFITDGEPNVYQSGERPDPTFYNSSYTLDSVLKSIDYKLGDVVKNKMVGNNNRISIDAQGNLTAEYKNNSGSWRSDSNASGQLHPEGNGTYELSTTTSDSWWYSGAAANAQDSFLILSKLSGVEAIGLNGAVNANDLKPYDSDQKPQTNIDPSKLAEAILGHSEATVPGNDTVNGGDGNDIIFGDLVSFGSITGNGVEALQAYVAGKLGTGIGDVDGRVMHKYIAEHYTEFDISRDNDGNDFLNGGNGNDILFGQGGIDRLDGGKGNDILLGGSGDDILIGGQGDDILIGGSGKDTFVWKAGDYGNDVIKDFKAAEGDRIDLKDLLVNESGKTIDNYLKMSFADGSTTLQISSEGKLNAAGGIANADVTIKLEGVNLSSNTINSLISGSDPMIRIDNKDG